jgi:DNA-binding CsgD family transcriptional regulator
VKLDLDEDEIIRLVNKGLSSRQIAERFKVSERVIQRRRRDLGIPGVQVRYDFTPEQEAQIERWLEDEVPMNEIARSLGVSVKAIQTRYKGRAVRNPTAILADCRKLMEQLGLEWS